MPPVIPPAPGERAASGERAVLDPVPALQTLYRHEALVYAGDDQFVARAAALAGEALERDERVILLAGADKLNHVQDALGPDGDDVALVATDEHGRNPSRITTLLDSFQASGDGRRCLGLSEPVFRGRSPAAQREAQFAESVLNVPQLRSWPFTVVCLYDAAGLGSAALAEMRRSHPEIHGEGGNDDYEPDLAGDLFSTDLGPPPAEAAVQPIGRGGLARTRTFVRRSAQSAALAPDRLDDLILAVNEVVTNSLRHGGGRCRVAIWHESGSVICEVRDGGHITDPLVGRLAPPPTAPAGRGLWLANHLCDLVQIRSSQAGTVVRLFVDR